jgi:hypothetical protein
MSDFNTELLKGKISLNDYIAFMFEVREQNKRIENKLDIITGEIAKLKAGDTSPGIDEEGGEADFFTEMIKNVMENDPEVKKSFGNFFKGNE